MAVDLQLREILRRWGLRLRLAESLVWGPWGAAIGLGAGLLMALVARVRPLLMARQVLGFAGLAALGGLALGLASAWLRPRPLPRLARVFDRRFLLAERLMTAVEIGSGHLLAAPALSAAQLADTLQSAARVAPREMLPVRASRWALAMCGVLVAALALLFWLPNPQEDALLQQAALQAAVEEQIEALQEVREEVAGLEGLSETERELLLDTLDETIAALEEGQATLEEAIAALSEAEQALAALQDPAAAAAEEALQDAAEALENSELTEGFAEALAEGDILAAAEELAEIADEAGESLTSEEQQELAQELQEAAEALAESNPELAQQLSEAAEALESGDVEAAQEAMLQAAELLEEAGEQVEKQEAIEGVLAELQEGREKIAGLGEGDLPGAQPALLPQTQPGHHEDAGSGEPYGEDGTPDRLDEDGTGVDVGREGQGGVPIGSVSIPAPEGGRPNVPYEEVYTDYAEQAGAALEGSYIPLGMKQYVRDYFSSLEP